MFFNNLELMCSNKKIKMTQLLKELQLSKSAISRWRSGVLPNGEILIKIADFFECSIDYLVGRTDDPTWHKSAENSAENIQKTPVIMEKPKILKEPKPAKITLPLYPQSASAGSGNYLFNAEPIDINVEKNSKTVEADFLVRVSGDSMLPKYHDGDIVLVKQTPSVFEGEIGIFYVDGDSYIKQMGSGELISINPDYPNIAIKTCNDVRCFGQVIGVLDV